MFVKFVIKNYFKKITNFYTFSNTLSNVLVFFLSNLFSVTEPRIVDDNPKLIQLPAGRQIKLRCFIKSNHAEYLSSMSTRWYFKVSCVSHLLLYKIIIKYTYSHVVKDTTEHRVKTASYTKWNGQWFVVMVNHAQNQH